MPERPRPFSSPTVIAIDWSGRLGIDQIHAIRAAVARDGEIEVWADLTRDDVVAALLELREQNVVVGMDFSFGYPSWVGRWHGCRDGSELWPIVAADGERWLETCPPPFFGAKGTRRPERVQILRACETRVGAKSTFQVAGSGHVGTGTIRGIPCLMRLRAAGFAVWPFDAVGSRTIVEIYPSALRRNVDLTTLPPRVKAAVANNENTRDAVASALVMWEHRDQFATLRAATDETTRLEGDIWTPASTTQAELA
jgi:hypothetical protein